MKSELWWITRSTEVSSGEHNHVQNGFSYKERQISLGDVHQEIDKAVEDFYASGDI